MISKLARDINHLCEEVYEKISSPIELLFNVKEIQCNVIEICKFAPDYDFNGVQGNGYWSWVHICKKYLNLLLNCYQKNMFINQDLVLISKLLVIYTQNLRKIRKSSEENSINSDKLDLSPHDLDLATDLLMNYYVSVDLDLIRCVYGKYLNFWLPSICRKSVVAVHSIGTFLNLPLKDYFKFWSWSVWDLALAKRFRNFTIKDITSLRFGSNNWTMARLLAALLNGVFYPKRKEIKVPRQHDWVICRDTFNLIKHKIIPSKKHIYCIVLSGRKPNGTVILSFHGGGYMLCNAASNEFYYRKWVKRIPESIVISVDYSLAPESKLPEIIQEVLDVYLWLTSGKSDVEEVIGVKPKEILLEGDSAGCHLATSLLMILNDIRKGQPGSIEPSDVLMPKAVFGVFPLLYLKPYASPSLLLSTIDGIITTSIFLNGFKAFLPLKSKNEKRKLSEHGKTPWFKEEIGDFRNDIKEIIDISSRRYFDISVYDDIESLKDVNLHLFAGQFDSLLDMSVIMANKWKGTVTLDIFDDLPHAWVAFNVATSCKEASSANETLFKKLAQYFP